jgi:hypothetical protein
LRASASLAAGLLKQGQRIARGAFRRAKEALHTGRFVLALDLAASGLRELPRENKPLARAERQAAPMHRIPSDWVEGVARSTLMIRPLTCLGTWRQFVDTPAAPAVRREAEEDLGPITSIPQKEFSNQKARIDYAEQNGLVYGGGQVAGPQLTPAPAFSVGTTPDPQAGAVNRGQALVGAGKPLRTRTRTDIGQCQK